jgi:hypothetical protein
MSCSDTLYCECPGSNFVRVIDSAPNLTEAELVEVALPFRCEHRGNEKKGVTFNVAGDSNRAFHLGRTLATHTARRT